MIPGIRHRALEVYYYYYFPRLYKNLIFPGFSRPWKSYIQFQHFPGNQGWVGTLDMLPKPKPNKPNQKKKLLVSYVQEVWMNLLSPSSKQLNLICVPAYVFISDFRLHVHLARFHTWPNQPRFWVFFLRTKMLLFSSGGKKTLEKKRRKVKSYNSVRASIFSWTFQRRSVYTYAGNDPNLVCFRQCIGIRF